VPFYFGTLASSLKHNVAFFLSLFFFSSVLLGKV